MARAPLATELWVGLADWLENRWVWRRLKDVRNVLLPSHARFLRRSDGATACALFGLGTRHGRAERAQDPERDACPSPYGFEPRRAACR